MTQYRPPSSPPISTSRAGSLAAEIDLTCCDDEDSFAILRLRERISALTFEVRSLGIRLRHSEVSAQVAKDSLLDLNQHVDELKNKCDGLLDENDGLRRENRQLRGDYASLQDQFTNKEDFAARLSETNESLRQEQVKLKTELQKALNAKNQALTEAQNEREHRKDFQIRCQELKIQVIRSFSSRYITY